MPALDAPMVLIRRVAATAIVKPRYASLANAMTTLKRATQRRDHPLLLRCTASRQAELCSLINNFVGFTPPGPLLGRKKEKD
ncbi:hypothetical protein [Cerasicoccus maritimus]|uniref:hypothetical protein n=1 Tax=Cerasicoccus maritimus TaxID=490089 RepID=UPI002852B25B|nr:hypothetical protein [Cerasicoccus maritimus]